MAGRNAMISSICHELSKKQSKTLAKQLESPIPNTNVALGIWQAWKKMGIGAVTCPASDDVNAMMDFPADMDGF